MTYMWGREAAEALVDSVDLVGLSYADAFDIVFGQIAGRELASQMVDIERAVQMGMAEAAGAE